MRQQYGGQPRVIFRLALFQPENFRSGEARQHGVARRANRGFEPAEPGHNFVALGRRRGVAPELGRPNDLAVSIERDEAMLLSAHADGLDLARTRLRQRQGLANGFLCRVTPGLRVLFLRAGRKVGNQFVTFCRRGDDLAGVRVEDEDLGGLRSAVDADQKCSHGLCRLNRCQDGERRGACPT